MRGSIAWAHFGPGLALEGLRRRGCACFTRNRQSSRSVRDAPGLFCQGCARSISRRQHPLPLGFSQVVILKLLKVVCFHTLLQVLILKDVRPTVGRTSFRA